MIGAAPRAGDVIGDHVLVARLGKGGMGEVWRATHRPTGAARALKLLPAAPDPEEAARFQREAEALGRLDAHPHLVRVHGAGVDAGRPWVAMELVEGRDLGARLAEGGPLPEAEAAALVRAVASAVAHAHARGVLHRDLKPSNVLLAGAGPRLVDFGLARVQGAGSLTRTGTLLGTPGFLAPEQARGERADARADVYGLGALLHAALTGRAPVEGAGAMDTLLRGARGEVVPLARARPGVSPALEAVVRRALATDPRARFPDAAALAEALAPEALGGAAPARGPSRRAVLGGLLGAALAGAALVAGGLATTPPPGGAGPGPASPAGTPSAAAAAPSSAGGATPGADGAPGGSPWPARVRAGERPGPRSVDPLAREEARRLAARLELHPFQAVRATPRRLREALGPPERAALERYAAAGVPVAQEALARLLCADDPARAADLAWAASRPTGPWTAGSPGDAEPLASGVLAYVLLERATPPDPVGARWVVAEALAGLRDRMPPAPPEEHWRLAVVSARLGGPADLGRALRAVRALRHRVPEAPAPKALHDPLARLLPALAGEHGLGERSGRGALERALRAALADPDPAVARAARAWVGREGGAALQAALGVAPDPGPPLLDVLDEADAAFVAPRPSWRARLEADEPAPRPAADADLEVLDREADRKADDLEADPAAAALALGPLAARGSPRAQERLGELLAGRDPGEGARLLWLASRQPRPRPSAGLRLARLLLAGPPGLRDVEGGRWLLAETATLFARRVSLLGVESSWDPPRVAEASAQLDRPADLARALRLIRDGRFGRDLARRSRGGVGALVLAAAQDQGWGLAADPAAARATLAAALAHGGAGPEREALLRAARTWVLRHPDPAWFDAFAAPLGLDPAARPPRGEGLAWLDAEADEADRLFARRVEELDRRAQAAGRGGGQ